MGILDAIAKSAVAVILAILGFGFLTYGAFQSVDGGVFGYIVMIIGVILIVAATRV